MRVIPWLFRVAMMPIEYRHVAGGNCFADRRGVNPVGVAVRENPSGTELPAKRSVSAMRWVSTSSSHGRTYAIGGA